MGVDSLDPVMPLFYNFYTSFTFWNLKYFIICLGLMNPIIEIDTLRHRREMNVDNWCKILKKRFQWIKKNFGPDAKIFVNFRDFSDAMFHDVAPVLKIALFMGMLPPDLRPFGLMFEEPRGTYLPEEVGNWCGGKRSVNTISIWVVQFSIIKLVVCNYCTI